MEEEDFKNLPVEERCVHKLWKARVSGYEEVAKLFQQIDDEKSPEFAKYLGLIKKFVTDSNAVGQEKGLEATLAYVENYAHAGKTVGEVMSGIVAKCMAASRTRTRELAQQVTLMYMEIEKQDAVYEELLKGMDLKNPKIVTACVVAATHGLHDFGSKVVTVKPLVKKISTLFADRDKGVRDEARLLAVEIFRWIGPVLKSQLTSLQPVQVAELETEFAKVEGRKPKPCRYLRSQQEKQAKMAAEVLDDNVVEADDDDCEPEAVNLDPYDLADPVDIISKLPKDFFDKLEDKNWKERKEVLEILDNLVKTPKLENGDYGDIVRALKKVVNKDSNVICVALAAKCITGLADGLKKRFHTYASACVPALLEKFKEKKQNVVLAVRDAIDAVYITTNIEIILEDVLEALANKNPAVKSETSFFLARAFCKTPPTAMNKKLLKAYTGGLTKLINEPDPVVRDSAAEAIGTLMKLVTDKAIRPFIVELEKDALKIAKIKECCDKAVITVKVSRKEKTAKPTAVAVVTPVVSSGPKPVARAGPKAPPRRRPDGSAPTSKPKSGAARKAPTSAGSISSATAPKIVEREIGEDEAVEVMAELVPADVIAGLVDTNWKIRLAAIEQLNATVEMLDASTFPTQACVRLVCKKPGLKDTNFQVLKGRLDVVKYLATNCSFSSTSSECCLNDITEKLSDSKNGVVAGETLTAVAEATSLSDVSVQVLEFAFTQKNPKVVQESLAWLSTAIKEFGFANLNAKLLIDNAKKALASNNPAVRQSGITLFGSLYLFMGPNLHVFLESEKQVIRDQINVEFEKYENEKPPTPIRGVKISTSATTDSTEQDSEEQASPAINPLDLLPKVDISPQITDILLAELADKNWQVRNEALNKVTTIIAEARMIKPTLGELPDALALRLVDSNTKIAQNALNVCEALAKGMSSAGRQHIRTLFPGFLQGLGDSKAWIRAASLSSINAFAEQCGYKEFFESEMIHDALKSGSPTLRTELWAWLAEVLPKIKSVPKDELLICVLFLYTNLEDRNADVRKNAGEAVLGMMIHLGYNAMVKQTEKIKPSSKPVIQAILDKVRPNLPEKPQAPSKKQAEDKPSAKALPRASTAAKVVVKKSSGTVVKPVAGNRKKDDEIDTSPLFVVNNLKHQRTIDETKLKVLKWNFTTPREEFVDLLKEQMTTAGVNKTLMQNMFHSDFKYHIKAIESLSDDLVDSTQGLMSNLDLVLKWLTLRFFDTNPSVLLKGLEYLNAVYTMLAESGYHMLDNEASSFIPYLVLKVGDPKDSVRNGVRVLFNHISSVYPISKLFSYIMEGLKSKNARQRAECLEVMGNIIGDYGMCVCQPSESVCIKEVAKQISDRDNSVRNAALNCVVQAFYIVGERVYKLVGKISDKDLSLLEERIKRASKQRPKLQQLPPVAIVTTIKPLGKFGGNLNATVIHNKDGGNGDLQQSPTKSVEDQPIDDYQYMEDEEVIPEVALPPQVVEEPAELTGPFQLDPEFLRKLDSMHYELREPKLLTFDLDFLKEDVVMPTLADSIQTATKPTAAPMPISFATSSVFSSASSLPQRQLGINGQEIIVQNIIINMGSPEMLLASQAFDQLQAILQSQKSALLMNLEDQFMTSISKQLKFLVVHDPKTNITVAKLYKSLLTVVDSFYANRMLGQKVTMPVLKDVLMQFITLLIESRLDHCPGGDTYVRVINIHCVKIIERSNHTAIICALVQLLADSLRNNQPDRIIDLVMKCLWRIIKIIPNWAEDLAFDDILLQIHLFLCEFPSSWWKTRDPDTPLRTIKTVIHSMTKIKGAGLMLHLGQVPNSNDSEMESFILKLLKNLKMDEVKTVPFKTDSGNASANTTVVARRSLSKSTHSQLTEIFQKIGSKEETIQGMNLLYDFMQQHPEEDIEPFLKRSSQFFQDYIQRNLREIEKSRKAKANGTDSKTPSDDDKGPEYYRERLEAFLQEWDEKVKSFHGLISTNSTYH